MTSYRNGSHSTIWAILFFTLFLCGCATWSKHGVAPQYNGKFRIAVAPIQSGLNIKKLKYIQSLPKNFVHPHDEKMIVQRQFEITKLNMTHELEKKLVETERFELAPDTDVERAMLELHISTSGEKMTNSELSRLGKKLDVSAVLNVTIGGYGKIKRKWKLWLIGSAISEAIFQGVITAEILGNPWIGAGIATEEVISETVQWGGGIYFFNRIFTPIVLDARGVSVFDKKSIWRGLAVATMNFKALNKLPKEERKKKEIRLQLVSDKALDKLVRSLQKAAKRNAER